MRSLIMFLFGAACLVSSQVHAADPEFLIDNVVVIDGTGAAPANGAVRVEGGRIAAVGDLEPEHGETVIDGQGLTLAPGFIDTHSHADRQIVKHRDALAHVSQGITTAVVGQDGTSPMPLANWFEALERQPAALNIAAYAGHNSLRRTVMSDNPNRKATAGEIERMGAMLQEDLAAGALGLGTGLEYTPGIYSDPDEVLALAKLAAVAGGRYISHIRSEDRWVWKAVDEAIEIGRQTGMPVQISHIKLAMKSLWGRAGELTARLDAARAEGIDITADIYPYEYWMSNIMVLIPSRDPNDRAEFEFALRELAPAEGIWLQKFEPHPEYEGKRLPEISALMGTDPLSALMALGQASMEMRSSEGNPADRILAYGMTEPDIFTLMKWPHSNICTDGDLEPRHPRSSGSFPRVLGRYVREQGLMSLEAAIYKMSGLSARHTGIMDRGTIATGQAADLVLFDPDTVIDHATPDDPKALSTGIVTVWVNGRPVFDQGATTGLFPGRVLRRTTL